MELITIKDLCKSYGNGGKKIDVLKGINLTVNKGETIAIVGASGAGKSTLLNIMGTLDRPTSGDVRFMNEPVFDYDGKRLAAFRNRTIGFVFQFHHLLPEFTAVENVMLPALISGAPFDAARSRAAALLGEVGLSERLGHKPGELSGGEQQRCAIVRAVIQDPGMILADEPTGNLDARTGDEVFALLLGLNRDRGTPLVVVTHNERLASRMTRRIMMSDGSLTEG
ncbi:MAG: ABC transporter ATP-binding protein [Deltaproteobacteria bacterium]|nr:ABC transporter ATP-binding protein [Deltaproteobacteria bacterium]